MNRIPALFNFVGPRGTLLPLLPLSSYKWSAVFYIFRKGGPFVLLSEIEIKHCQVLLVHNVSRIRFGKVQGVTQANKIENQPRRAKRGSSEPQLKQNQTSDQKTPITCLSTPLSRLALCSDDAMRCTRTLARLVLCPQPRRSCMMGKRLRGSSSCDRGHVAT